MLPGSEGLLRDILYYLGCLAAISSVSAVAVPSTKADQVSNRNNNVHSDHQLAQHPKYPIKLAGPSAEQCCNDLAAKFKSSGLTLLRPFSQYWPQGSNPSMELLAATLPPGTFPEVRPSVSTLLASSAPDFDVSRDGGYGWNERTQFSNNGPLGGLPAFCRFTAAIETSELTSVFVEVWMPLAYNVSDAIVAVNGSDYPTNSTPVEIDASGKIIKGPPSVLNLASSGTLLDVAGPSAGGSSLLDSSKADKSQLDKLVESSGDIPLHGDSLAKAISEIAADGILNVLLPSGETGSDASRKRTIDEDKYGHKHAPLSGHEVLGPSSHGWNGRSLVYIPGGQRGNIAYPSLKQIMSRYGFAVSTSNMGHWSSTTGVTWVNGSQYDDTLLDWGSRATHVTKQLSDEVIKAFYGHQGLKKSYVAGCSVGGKGSLASAQEHPGDFDGILAGCPAVRFNRLNAGQLRLASRRRKKVVGEGWFSFNKLQGPAHEVILEQCDTDGVDDGVVTNPRTCQPDFRKDLLCGLPGAKFGGSNETCFNVTQLANLETVYNATILEGEQVYPPYPYSFEQEGAVDGQNTKAAGWFSLAVNRYANLEVDTTDYYVNLTLDDVHKGDIEGAVWNAGKTDLSKAFESGTKILSYHGLSDRVISPYATAKYLEDAAADSGLSLATVKEHWRHYEIPGMSHCRDGHGPWHFGGAGQEGTSSPPLRFDTRHDLLLSLVAWTELGHIEPFQVGAHYKNVTVLPQADADAQASVAAADGGEYVEKDEAEPSVYEYYDFGVDFTRKLCAFPYEAVYDGEGDPEGEDAWRHFKCKRMPPSAIPLRE